MENAEFILLHLDEFLLKRVLKEKINSTEKETSICVFRKNIYGVTYLPKSLNRNGTEE